ncbi:MAG: S41 family peptidase [Clostridiales bacterium]|nr:S41 family peptidase [Clostridiales bacterium]
MTGKKKTVLCVVVTAVVTALATSIAKDIAFMHIADINTTKKLESKLNMINACLDSNYIYDYDKEQMSEMAVMGYVEGLDEPYTHYYDPKTFSQYTDSLEESYVGIGAVISVTDEDELVIVSTYEGSSSFEAGILPGDIITAVEGEPFVGDQLDEAVSKIRTGEEGTTVTISFKRDGESFDKTVERRRVTTNSVKAQMLDGNIGYVRISAFNSADEDNDIDTYTEFKENVEKLRGEGMEKMIIDLRDNPGGSLDVVCSIADMLLPEGIITYMEYKDGSREDYKSDAEELGIPMAVLINENSASASEVLTGALKDYKKAQVIGEKSYGKGVVQSVIPFSDGSGMSVTIARYFSPNGVCIHGTGIEPDIEVAMPEEYKNMYASQVERDKDTQLQKAIEILNK